MNGRANHGGARRFTAAERQMHPYDSIHITYTKHRQPDARIAGALRSAVGDARTLVNVGAGTGSYEPEELAVTAVEPSWRMISQRVGKAPVVRAVAEQLPFRDASFDVALAVLTVHHWKAPQAGLREMLRVARHRVVVFTWDPDHEGFWLTRDYFPDLLAQDGTLFPPVRDLETALGGVRVQAVPIPADCRDGFLGAYWKRPSAYLDAEVRASISTFSKIPTPATGLERLRRDLESGRWLANNDAIMSRAEMDLGYRLIIANGSGGGR